LKGNTNTILTIDIGSVVGKKGVLVIIEERIDNGAEKFFVTVGEVA
jgi:hypothetical protein